MTRKSCKTTLLSLLICTSLLTGCSGNTESAVNSTEEPAETAEATTGNVPEVTEPSVPESTEPSPELFSGELGGLRYFNYGENELCTVNGGADRYIISNAYTENGVTVRLLDITTGKETSADIMYDDPVSIAAPVTPFIVSGLPVAVDCSDGTIHIYDHDMNPVAEKTTGCESICCLSSESTLALTDSQENRVIMADISESGAVSTREYDINAGDGFNVSVAYGELRTGEVLMSCFNNTTYEFIYGIYSAESGSFTKLAVAESENAAVVSGNIVVYGYGSSSVMLFDPDTPDMKRLLEAPAGSGLISPSATAQSLYFYGCAPSEDGGSVLSVYRYDPESCRMTAAIETDITSAAFYLYSAYECGDSVILVGFDGERDIVLLWQPEELSQQYGYTALAGSDLTSRNEALARRISDSYSVDVNYGSDGVRYFDSYAVVAETDEKLINSALTTIDGFFAKFPAGFFSELFNRTALYDGISVYLTGAIVPNLSESQSISDAAAFVTVEGTQQLMVVDITLTAGLEANIAHEFMHIIENAVYGIMWNGEDWTDIDAFCRWDILNPDDFSYYYSYTDEYGTTLGYDAVKYNGAMYYDGCGTDINSIYFVDGYSMTYPSEDRARIFENIAVCSPDNLPAYFRGTGMQLKAAYLCACIREAFDCITDDTVLFWEKSIDPKYTLEYFKQNYDLSAYYQENAVG